MTAAKSWGISGIGDEFATVASDARKLSTTPETVHDEITLHWLRNHEDENS